MSQMKNLVGSFTQILPTMMPDPNAQKNVMPNPNASISVIQKQGGKIELLINLAQLFADPVSILSQDGVLKVIGKQKGNDLIRRIRFSSNYEKVEFGGSVAAVIQQPPAPMPVQPVPIPPVPMQSVSIPPTLPPTPIQPATIPPTLQPAAMHQLAVQPPPPVNPPSAVIPSKKPANVPRVMTAPVNLWTYSKAAIGDLKQLMRQVKEKLKASNGTASLEQVECMGRCLRSIKQLEKSRKPCLKRVRTSIIRLCDKLDIPTGQ